MGEAEELTAYRDRASSWEANELERRTAARITMKGFVPALNVVHPDTQSEFDIYAFVPHATSVTRLMVQCSLSAPTSQKLMALRGYAWCFSADHCLYVTAANPHRDQIKLADLAAITLVSERAHSQRGSGIVAEQELSVQTPLSPREESIISFLRCMARLRRVAWDGRHSHRACGNTVQTWHALDSVSLIFNPFDRLAHLYNIHWSAPALAEDCAVAEGLGLNGPSALKQAYAYNQGTYTQSALAVQTLNRAHTLIALCECACLVAGGQRLPPTIYSVSGNIARTITDLSAHPARHLLGIFAFEFLYGWGGFWQEFNIDPFRETIASHIGARPEQIDDMIALVDNVFGGQNVARFIVSVEYQGAKWRNLTLLPYFAKGIGIRRIEAEGGLTFDESLWSDWKAASEQLEQECQAYEQSH